MGGPERSPLLLWSLAQRARGKVSLINAEDILQPKTEEKFSPESRTGDLWAG